MLLLPVAICSSKKNLNYIGLEEEKKNTWKPIFIIQYWYCTIWILFTLVLQKIIGWILSLWLSVCGNPVIILKYLRLYYISELYYLYECIHYTNPSYRMFWHIQIYFGLFIWAYPYTVTLQSEIVAYKFKKNKYTNKQPTKQTNKMLYGHSHCVLLMLVLACSMKPTTRLNII